MKNQPDPSSRCSEDDALTELANVLPAGDRLRVAALGQAASFSAAKEKSLLRQEKMLVARFGPDSPEARRVRSRLDAEKRFTVAAQAEVQRPQAEVVARNPDALTLHGRVVNPQRVGMPRLTVSAMDDAGRPLVYTSSNDQGYYALAVPATGDTKNQNVTLLVSNQNKDVLYRGQECFAREPRKVFYRDLVIGTAEPETQPTPPPDIDPKSVTVPDVRGLEEMTARAQIRAVGLSVESTTEESTRENAGRVIEQSPNAGAKVAPCSLVNLVVGAQSKVQVPDLIGKTLREARQILKEAHLSTGKIEPSDASLESRVVQQSPAAGEEVAPETTVDLVVEEPVQQLPVPGVVGLRLPDAKRRIAEAGFTIGKITPSNATERSVIVSQSPAEASQAESGSAVDLVAREPSEKIRVPNVVEQRLSAAREILEKARLKPGKITPPNAPGDSIVIRQSPTQGSEVDEGAPVDLEVKPPQDDTRPRVAEKAGPRKKTSAKRSARKKK